MRLLLVEDNQTIASNITAYLELEGYHIIHCADGSEGLTTAQKQWFDLIVLDIMLPGMDGFTLCKKIREKKKDVPIIMTTAKGQLEDKGEGFDAGADDYLVKPFHMEELVMRINALLRRNEEKDMHHWGDIDIFLQENMVVKSGQQVHLTTKERQLLSLLIEANGRVVERVTIADQLWGDEAVWGNDAKIDVYVANLRKKLDREMIQTVKSVGYRISKQ